METTAENPTKEKRRNVCDIINARIIEKLENGIVLWRENISGLPKNLITGKQYRGINVLLLASLGFERNYFFSFNQVKNLGATVKPGEKPCPVIYWKQFDGERNSGGTLPKPALRYFNLYNISQVDGIPEEKIPTETNPSDKIQVCREIFDNIPNNPDILNDTEIAYYSHEHDYISMPKLSSFENEECYYETLFHEIMHSVWHPKRLIKRDVATFITGNEELHNSLDELIAQIGVFMLKAHAGIKGKSFTKNILYNLGWVTKFKADGRFIIYASTKAQQAVDYILNVKKEETL